MPHPESVSGGPPESTPSRTSRTRRVVALAAASVLTASSLVMINDPSASAKSTVPEVADLAGDLADQKLEWETCDFGSPEYNDLFNQPNVSCATVTVPRDWHDPDNGKTWQIRISQAHNIDVDNPRYQGTVFANPGGPGGEGLVWGPALQQMTPDLNPYYNYVGFDPRGVGQSSHAECSYEWDPNSDDPNAELKAAGEACSTDEDVRTISTEQTTYDMDLIRHLLEAPKLSYIGYSYGTWLGAWYEKVFGAKYGDKFLLDSSIDSTEPTLEKTWDLQPISRDRQFEQHMMNWIARHDADYGLGEDPQAIYSRYFEATEKLDPTTVMLVWMLLGGASAFSNNADYPLAGDVVQLLIEEGEATTAQQRSQQAKGTPADQAQELLTSFADRTEGKQQAKIKKASKAVEPLTSVPTRKQQRTKSTAALEQGTLDEPFEFVRCNDGQWTQGEKYWDRHNAKQAKKAPLSDQWGIVTTPICAFWRTNTLMPVADKSFPDTIVVQGEMDSQTAWEGGRVAGTKLPNTSLIAIDNEGTHGIFPYGTEQVDRKIINYFLDGKQPKNISRAQAKPLPGDDQTYQTWRKLNKKAKHVGPLISDPWVPAKTGAQELEASPVGKQLLAEESSSALLRQQVRKTYGAEGVEALESAGVI